MDDICTVNLKYFGDIAKDIYDKTLLLESSACSYKQDTFWLFISMFFYDKFVTGIYKKKLMIFEVINYLFNKAILCYISLY